jgi:uncharacterized repeat protein (TIGR03847 family)
MTRRAFLFETPDRFAAGTVGEPGDRTFFLQAREGTRIASVVLEKIQVAALAQRLGDLLLELDRRGVSVPTTLPAIAQDVAPLDEPIVELFRVGTLTIGWDPAHELVVLEALAMSDEDEEADDDEDDDAEDDIDDEDETVGDFDLSDLVGDGDDGPDLLRVRLTPAAAAGFVERATRVVAAGRPPCPLCGRPLDPQGHLCPRKNGYLN